MIVGIEMTINVPDGYSSEEIEAWIEYATGYKSSIDSDNPLLDRSLEPQSLYTTL